MEKILHFKTHTLLKNLVGKDLINDDNIAIVELVKNSYDAGSGEVLVRFSDFSDKDDRSTDSSKIIIADQGCGMDLADIQDKWLNIAYSEKILLDQKSGSYVAGNKGIGRFSCDRLGEQLELLTRKQDNELLYLIIKWLDFEQKGDKDLTIQTVPLKIISIDEKTASKISGLSDFPKTGTVLVISTLRSVWNRDRLRSLKISLEKFLNPNQLFLGDRFKINLSVPALDDEDKKRKNYAEQITGEIQNQIFDKLKFKSTYIETKISDDGKTILTELHHEGENVFYLEEYNEVYKLLSGIRIVIYYLNPYKKAYFKRQAGVRSVDFGSIFLFLNGFRIAPYGDRGDDWLGLDVRKAQGTARYLGSRDIVGRIEITNKDDEFTPISSREGLKNTATFHQLRENFFLDVLRKLEKFVVEGLQWDSVPKLLRQELINSDGLEWDQAPEQYQESWERKKQRIALSILPLIGSSPDKTIHFGFNPALLDGVYENRKEEVKELLAEIEGIEPGKIDSDLTKSLLKIRTVIEEKEKEAEFAKADATELRVSIALQQDKINQLEGETQTYRAQTLFLQQVTSLDVKQLMSYHHQINLDATIVNNYIAKAIKALRNKSDTKEIMDCLQKAVLANNRIASVAQYATKANFRAGTKKEPTDIPAFFEQYLLNVAKDFIAAGLNLEVVNKVKENFELMASRIELSILIDNIVSNAGKAQAHKLVIMISKESENLLRISFIDDGKGISKELPTVDAMFEMGITTTSGSGLGLYHARRIVESIGGKIIAIPLEPNGMEIRMEVTR